jgi:hypothetical protein
MRRLGVSLATAVATLASGLVLAQDKPGTIARVGVFEPKPGTAQQFEQARKKHFEFHRKNNDSWAWFTWEVISGEHTGRYVTGTFGHHWKDFDAWDKLEKADSADADATMGPYIQAEFPRYYAYLPDASHPPEGKEPTSFAQVTHFYVKLSGVQAFMAAIKEAKQGLDKVNWPVRTFWYQMVTGGEGPEFVLVVARSSWADFEPGTKTLDEALAEVYGPQKAIAVVGAVRDNTRYTYSELLRYRPDLSYIPATK